jgi:aminopeptidase N
MRGHPDPLAALAQSTQTGAGPGPLDRLHEMATEVASALDFMASRFGPPALPHLTVSPIPGAFGQGFPGLIYLSTMSYLKTLPGERPASEQTDLVLRNMLQAHELAHQWWGDRVTTGADRDTWLMEALANYSALLYLEKSKGRHAMETMLDSYRRALLEKGENGQTVESNGPIVLGTRLHNSVEPRAWHDIIYGKGTWIMQMLRERMGDHAFISMLAELVRRYDRKEVTTEQFRELAAQYLPPRSEDPQLELFFDQWVYGTGLPSLTMSYAVQGKAPALKLRGTVTQSGVDEDFRVAVPVEIQVTRDRAVTQWVRTGGGAATFTVALKQAPLKVTLDPHYAVLRK